jgi:hypothetical protein
MLARPAIEEIEQWCIAPAVLVIPCLLFVEGSIGLSRAGITGITVLFLPLSFVAAAAA